VAGNTVPWNEDCRGDERLVVPEGEATRRATVGVRLLRAVVILRSARFLVARRGVDGHRNPVERQGGDDEDADRRQGSPKLQEAITHQRKIFFID